MYPTISFIKMLQAWNQTSWRTENLNGLLGIVCLSIIDHVGETNVFRVHFCLVQLSERSNFIFDAFKYNCNDLWLHNLFTSAHFFVFIYWFTYWFTMELTKKHKKWTGKRRSRRESVTAGQHWCYTWWTTNASDTYAAAAEQNETKRGNYSSWTHDPCEAQKHEHTKNMLNCW